MIGGLYARAGVVAVALTAAVLLQGCAGTPMTHALRDASAGSEAVELTAVPFHPQERWQCGPAALATVLQWNGIEATPDELVGQVYVPARRGSLQPEMLASTRRHGLAPYVLAPRLAAIIAELEAGQPVLVLQNLAWSWAPRWHYAVVIGFDPGHDEVILRSGTIERHRMPLGLFERTWRRAGHWAFVASDPAHPPASAEELPWLRTVLAMEQGGQAEAAGRGWRAATQRWPQSAGAWMGLGNHLFGRGDFEAAAASYRHLLDLRPDYAPALNNLARSLDRLGEHAAAESLAARAFAADPENAVYRSTLSAVRARGQAPDIQ